MSRVGASSGRVILSARPSTSAGSFEVRIRDVSATDARVEGAELPAPGWAVALKRGSFTAFAQLKWVDDSVGGILFDEPLDEEEMMDALKGLPTAQPQAPYRRPGLNRGDTHARFSDGQGWVDLPATP